MDDYVLENGEWGPKRLYPFVNAWMPAILINGRCNNDIKLLLHGVDTKNITFYTTIYAAKKQGRNYNVSAILSDGYAYHIKHPNAEYMNDIRDNQRLLIFRLVHAINREQELAAAMVISYLMGWGDVFKSHKYSAIYWSTFFRAIVKTFPSLMKLTNEK
jgi:hypothetical protein